MTALPETNPVPASEEADLRPLSTSELIDRGFALYRANFAGFLLLALLCQLAPLLAQVIFTVGRLYPSPDNYVGGTGTLLMKGCAMTGVGMIAQVITFGLEVVLTFYLADAYLGNLPSVKESFRKFRKVLGVSIWTCILVRLLIGATLIFPLLAGAALVFYGVLRPPGDWGAVILFSIGGMFLVVASVVPLLIVFMRLMVTIPVIALEGLSGWAAVKRSSQLVRYDPGLGILYWGEMRLSFLLLPLFVIELLVLSLTSLPLILVQFNESLRNGSAGHLVAPSDATAVVSQILMFVAGALILPLYTIATTLFYYDVRIRREGFDLELMAERLRGKT